MGAIGRVPAGITPLLPSTDERRARPHCPSDAGARDVRYSQKGSADRWNVAVERRVSALLPLSHHSIRPMPTTLPQSVREHMGEQVAADFSRWFAENVQQELVTNDEYRKVLSRLDVLEERFDHVEERFDRVDERLDRMDERLRSCLAKRLRVATSRISCNEPSAHRLVAPLQGSFERSVAASPAVSHLRICSPNSFSTRWMSASMS